MIKWPQFLLSVCVCVEAIRLKSVSGLTEYGLFPFVAVTYYKPVFLAVAAEFRIENQVLCPSLLLFSR